MNKDFGMGDIVQMKKNHPCKKATTFEIVRMGVDIKIKCEGCGAIIMLDRQEFIRKLKKVIKRNEEII